MKLKKIALAIVVFTLTSCNGQPSKKVETLDAVSFSKKIEATPNPQILDVRTPEEYAAEHIERAQNVNWLSNDFVTNASKYDKSKPVFVYCKIGGRSHQAAEKLAQLGFTQIIELEGGFLKWDAAGLSKPSAKRVGITKEQSANLLNSGDSLVSANGSLIPVRFNGPKDSFSHLGKYVVVEGYKTLSFLTKDRKSLDERTPGEFQFKQSEHGVIYKSVASTEKTPNMTFSALVKFNRGTQSITIFDGFDNISNTGLVISCTISDVSGLANTTIHVNINGETHNFQIGEIQFDSWYSLIVPVSSQYGQLEVSVYGFSRDQANIKNYNGITKVFNRAISIGKFSFVTTQNWSLPAANYSICNVRLFNTMIQEEDHEFVISQLFVRDESSLELIDNARPRLNVPFIAINR